MLPFRKRHPKRKLFYPIGFLSLGLLPILFFQELASRYIEKTKPQHCLELSFPHKQKDKNDTIFIPEALAKARMYKNYILTNDEKKNEFLFQRVEKELNEIKVSRDTVNGIHILLNDSTHYKDFIRLIDISNEMWTPVYGAYENNFWTFYVNYQDTAFERRWKERHNKK